MVSATDDPLGRIQDGALAAREGRVVWIGKDRELEAQVTLDGDLLDTQGACVIPGLVDAHTHPVFAGSRADEFAERASGVPYAVQQSEERGIARTVRATREADEPTLLALALLVCACRKEHRPGDAQQQQTATIAPAAAQPDQSGTADAMTQTVEVDDSRSEGEGGTAAAPPPAKAPAKKPAKKKH